MIGQSYSAGPLKNKVVSLLKPVFCRRFNKNLNQMDRFEVGIEVI